jgi:O-antigen ligase/Flp pilus assembly protein TadD
MDNRKINRILLWIIKIGIFAILFTPFIVGSKFFFPFIVLKNVLFRVIVEIIFFAYLVLAMRDKRFRPKLNPIIISVFIFLGIVALTTFTGIGLDRGLWSNYERMGGLIRWIHLLLFFIILISVYREKKDWYTFFTFSIFTSFLIAFFGLAQKLEIPFLLSSSSGTRLTGTIGNPSYLAAYLIFSLFFLLYFIFKDKYFNLKLFVLSILSVDIFLIIYDLYFKFIKKPEGYTSLLTQIVNNKSLLLVVLLIQIVTFGAWFLRRKRWAVKSFIGLLFLLELTIFYWTQTRGAAIGFWLGVFILILFNLSNVRSRAFKKVSYAIIIFLALVPILLFSFRNTDFVKNNATLNRLASISTKNVSTHNRLLVWNASWQGWIENPVRFLIGYGQENYYYVFSKHFPTDLFQDLGSRIWFDRAHNIILDTGITSGLIGLLSYLAIFVLVLYYLLKWHKSQPQRFVFSFLIVLLIAYFIQNVFVFDTLNTLILFFLVLAFISSYLWHQKEERYILFQKLRDFWAKLSRAQEVNYIILGLALIIVVWGIYTNYRLLRANHYLYQCIQLKKNSNTSVEEILNLYQKAVDEAVTGRYEAREQLANYALQVVAKGGIPNHIKRQAITMAINELKKSVTEEPTHVRHYLYVASIINRATILGFEGPQKAIDYLEKAIPLSPERPQIYFELGQAYLLKKDFEKGVASFERGVELSPKVIDSHVDLAIAYVVTGNRQKAIEKIKEIKENESLYNRFQSKHYMRLIEAFRKVEDYESMISLYHDLLERYPDNPEYYAQLAFVYAYIGENEQAEKWAKKVLEVDPNYEADYEAFMEKLEKGELKRQE